MRHRMAKKSFNRDTKARRSLLNGVVIAVLEHGEIVTTRAKAKAAIPLIDSAISRAKVGDLAARRQLHRRFGRRDVVNNLCDRVAPVFANRQSGFTRLTLIGNRRGDNTALYRLSLVETLPPRRQSTTRSEAKPAPAKSNSQSSPTDNHDAQARQAVKLEQNKSTTTRSKIANLVGRQKTAGRASVVNGGRGK